MCFKNCAHTEQDILQVKNLLGHGDAVSELPQTSPPFLYATLTSLIHQHIHRLCCDKQTIDWVFMLLFP